MIRTLVTVASLVLTVAAVQAAEVKMISANGMREVIAETKARFEKTSGHRLNVTVVEAGAIRKRVLGGEAFDVIMVPSAVSALPRPTQPPPSPISLSSPAPTSRR